MPAAGRNFQVNQALTIAQLVGSVLLLLSEHSQLDTLEIDKVTLLTIADCVAELNCHIHLYPPRLPLPATNQTAVFNPA